jgi:uncharacterized membrane protein (DUF2068 family)
VSPDRAARLKRKARPPRSAARPGTLSGWFGAQLRIVAGIEFAKGALVLAAGAGLLTLVHRDVRQVAEQLIHHLHLDPASRAPRIFIDLADRLTSGELWLLALGAAIYAAARLIEGYGLWRDRAWAEWLGAVWGLVYVPFELHALSTGITALRLTTLIVNLVVVWVLASALARRSRESRKTR